MSTRSIQRSVRPINRNAWLGYVFVAPLMLWLAATILYPLLSAIALSMQDVKVIGTGGNFIGLQNYGDILISGRFWSAAGRSLLWVIGNGLSQTVLAFAAAIILRQSFPGKRLARVWIILSWIVPTVVVVIIWRWMLSASGGIVNYALLEFNLIEKPIGFFSTGDTAFTSVTLINSWRMFPFMTVIVLAGMMRIPQELYEAASVDGAASWQRFWNITLPGLQNVLFVIGLIGTLMSFNTFDVIWLMTGGGPSSATTTLPVLIYDTGFKQYRLSDAAAMSVITGILLLAYAALFMRFMSPDAAED